MATYGWYTVDMVNPSSCHARWKADITTSGREITCKVTLQMYKSGPSGSWNYEDSDNVYISIEGTKKTFTVTEIPVASAGDGVNKTYTRTFTGDADGSTAVNIKLWAKLTETDYVFDGVASKAITISHDKKTYTVSYNANGGSGAPSSQTKTYDVDLTLRTGIPTRTGHEFKYWNRQQDGSGTTNYKPGGTYGVNAATTMYAQWEKETYPVKYYANGGSGAPSSQTKTYGVDLTLRTGEPTRTGYKFLGWGTTASDTSVNYDPGDTYTKNASLDLYAIWQPYTLTINYYPNGATFTYLDGEIVSVTGSPITSSTRKYGTTYSDPILDYSASGNTLYFVKTGYHPKTDSDGLVIYNTKIDGSGYSIRQNPGSMTGQAVATKLGKDITSANASANLYAQWAANSYTVKFDANGGSGSMSSMSCKYDTTYTLTANAFTRTGYHFAGWAFASNKNSVVLSNKGSFKNLTSTNNGTVTLYAVWTVNSGKIYYYPNGLASNGKTVTGTATSSYPLLTSGTYAGASSGVHNFYYTTTAGDLYNVGTLFTAPTGYRNPAEASAWRVNSATATTYFNQATQNLSSYAKSDGAVIKLYPNWQANTYTVKYNANGGSGTVASSSHTYDVAKTLTDASTLSRTGYTFSGWATSKTGSKKYNNKASVTNLTSTNGGTVNLYAVWTGNNYTVTFNLNGGASVPNSTQSVTFGSSTGSNQSSNIPTHSNSDLVFTGWYSAATGGVKVWDEYGNPTNDGTYWKNGVWNYAGNKTLYARWVTQTEYYKIWFYYSGSLRAKEFIETGVVGTHNFKVGAIVEVPEIIETNEATYQIAADKLVAGNVGEY